VRAQEILKDKIIEVSEHLQVLEKERKSLEADASRKEVVDRLKELELAINELTGEKESLEDDYWLVTEPFGIQVRDRRGGQKKPIDRETYDDDNDDDDGHGRRSKSDQLVESVELRVLWILLMIFGLIEMIMIYGKTDFLNVCRDIYS
jgi:hypothetical protein